jgi:ABC-type nitrate/sulfonate/bicarbonate transport system permease component
VNAARRWSARLAAPALGLGTLVLAIALIQVLIASGRINRFIVPLPTEIAASFERVIVEEHVLSRFLLTAGEALAAGVLLTVVGIGIGVLLYRFRLLRLACETWVAALASAPLVLMYPLFLVIFGRSAMTMVMIGFVAALPPVILKTVEGLAGTRPGAGRRRAQLQAHASPAVLEDPVPRGAAEHVRRHQARAHLRADQHRRRRVSHQLRWAWPAHQ